MRRSVFVLAGFACASYGHRVQLTSRQVQGGESGKPQRPSNLVRTASSPGAFAKLRKSAGKLRALDVWRSLTTLLIALSNPVNQWRVAGFGVSAATPMKKHNCKLASRADHPKAFFGRLFRSQEVSLEVKNAAEDFAFMSAAVEISGGATSDFSANGGYPKMSLIRQRVDSRRDALYELLDACHEHAPALVAKPQACLPIARLAMWVPREKWLRPLEEWEGADLKGGADAKACFASLRRHLLENWETPSVLHNAFGFLGDDCSATIPEAVYRASYAFSGVLTAAGNSTASVKDALDVALFGTEGQKTSRGVSVVGKSVAKFFVDARPEDAMNPLHAFRRAQVAAKGGEVWVGDAVCLSEMGRRFLGAGSADTPGEGVTEVFGESLIEWVCNHAETLEEPSEVRAAIDFALEMRRSQDEGYSLTGRSPKKVAQALEKYKLTQVTFTDDEVFEPNPYGVRGLYETGKVIPGGTVLAVPYDREKSGGHGPYVLGEGSPEGRGVRPCTLRVTEILSLRRLIFEGDKLRNCLSNKYSSQVKYVMRARERSSSFWSFTVQYDDAPDEEPIHILLAEVWHLRRGNIIRQAEGPSPRTLPGPEAWYWLNVWCDREGIDLSTWGSYSRTAEWIRAPVL